MKCVCVNKAFFMGDEVDLALSSLELKLNVSKRKSTLP
jgi:hypothetical protein